MFHINGSIQSVPFAPGFLPLASSFQDSSIHTLACVSASFLCLAESYSLYGSHFTGRPHPRVHSSGDRHLCCFYLLAFLNDVAISFCVNTFSFPFDVHLGVQLLGHRLILYPNFRVNLLSKGPDVTCAQSDYETHRWEERPRMGFSVTPEGSLFFAAEWDLQVPAQAGLKSFISHLKPRLAYNSPWVGATLHLCNLSV